MWQYGGVAASAVVVLTVAVVVQEVAAARILVLTPLGVPSHSNFILAISEKLAERNHSVTLVTSIKPTRVYPNIKEVILPEGDLRDVSLSNIFTDHWMTSMSAMGEQMIEKCFKVLVKEEIQKLRWFEKFDLVIYGMANTDCLLPVAYKLQAPVIFLMPNVFLSTYSDLGSNPHFSSLSANYLLGLEHPLTFTGRMISSLYDQMIITMHNYWYLPIMQERCRELQMCPDDMPTLGEIRANSSLMIVNSVRTLENPALPYTPTVLHAGGIHCRPSQPLPRDLEEWAAGSGDTGFIFFSLGSVVKPSEMPEKYRVVLLEVFASLEQRVLWKWYEETMEGLPPNVRLSKWLPQQDILGHPRLQLFMTHGGLLSLQEATYHRVPVLGLPVYVDQKHNMNQVEREGWGHTVHWEDLTYHHLRHNIRLTIQDTRMREELDRRSSVMRDQPVSPGDWTTYWVEYVIRHRGATHLRCPSVHMPWYQLYNVDVWVMVVVVTAALVVLGCYLSYRSLRCLLAFCRATNKTKRE